MLNLKNKDGEAPIPINQTIIQQPKNRDSSGNRVYFYSVVDTNSVLDLIRSLNEKVKENKEKELEFSLPSLPIYLHINSPGGFIIDALSAMDTILELREKTPIYTIVEGYSCSCATFLSLVGTRRFIRRNSLMLIHQLSLGMWGKYDELMDASKNAKLIQDKINQIYKEYTRIPEKKIKEILKRDLYLHSKTCLKYGLVDQII